MIRTALWVLALLVSANHWAWAQPPERTFAPTGPFVFLPDEKISLRPDGSYLFQHTDGDLVFEAQLAPDVRVVDNVAESLRRVLEPTKPRVFAYSVYGTFLLRVRMFDERSNPVRTPSYMPKASIQLAWLKNLSTADPATEPEKIINGPIEMWLVHAIPFGHHSNGQNGCLFTDQVRVDDECVSFRTVPNAPRSINLENGSFSTNYVRAGVNYRRLYPAGDDPDDTRPITRREWGLGAHFEVHPTGYVGGSIDEELRPLYGTKRLKTTADVVAGNWPVPLLTRVTCGRAWAELSVEYINGAASSVPKLGTTIEASCLPAGWGGSGLFVRYYRGQDYYNASFLNSISRLQFGITFLQAKFLAFPLASIQ